MDRYFEIALHAYENYAGYLQRELTQPHARNWVLWLLAISLAAYAWELLRPWRRQQPRVRRDFWLDAFYMFFNFFLFALVIQHAGAEVLVQVFRDGLAQLGVENLVALKVSAWPAWAQILTLLVLRDLVHWNVHRLLHRVPWLWEFHKVHHSVTEMGFAAHLRFHPMETVVYRVLEYIPMALIGFGIDDFFAAHLIALIVGHLNHANIVLPLGPLRYVLNNPQMHIWHHAKHFPPQHPFGMNFGLTFSLWDFLFKTAYIPSDGRDLELGFDDVERFPRGLGGQLLQGFVRVKQP